MLDEDLGLPPLEKKMYDEMDFFEMMAENMDDFQTRKDLVHSVIQNAKEGDAASLKILERALMESKYKQEQKLIISDEQYENIILLASDRIRSQRKSEVNEATY